MEIGGWLKNDKKQLKPSRVDNSGVRGLHPAKTGTVHFISEWQGSRGAFCLILALLFLAQNGQGIRFFGRCTKLVYRRIVSPVYCVFVVMVPGRRLRFQTPATVNAVTEFCNKVVIITCTKHVSVKR